MRNNNILKVKEFNFEIDDYGNRNLITEAIKTYNSYHNDLDGSFADIYCDVNFLKKITANYIRHRLTNYDYLLVCIKGKIGAKKIYFEIRNIIDQKIDVMVENIFKKYHKDQ